MALLPKDRRCSTASASVQVCWTSLPTARPPNRASFYARHGPSDSATAGADRTPPRYGLAAVLELRRRNSRRAGGPSRARCNHRSDPRASYRLTRRFTALPISGAYRVDIERREDERISVRTFCADEFVRGGSPSISCNAVFRSTCAAARCADCTTAPRRMPKPRSCVARPARRSTSWSTCGARRRASGAGTAR